MADEELTSEIENEVRMMFRKGEYAEAVPFIQQHLEAKPDDAPALELMSTALKFSGDKPGAAGALITGALLRYEYSIHAADGRLPAMDPDPATAE